MKFSAKITLLFSGIVLSISVIVSYFVYTSTIDHLERNIRNNMTGHAVHSMDKIERILFERFADIKFLATDPVISSRSSTPEQITSRLINFKDIHSIYRSISFFHLDRVKIAGTSGDGGGKRHAFTEYWPAIAEGKSSVMTVSPSESLHSAVFYFASVVNDRKGVPLGVVVARIPVSELGEIIKGASGTDEVREDFEMDLVDGDGLILYSNHNQKGILKDIIPDWEVIKALKKNGKEVGTEKHPGEKGDDDGDEILAFATEKGFLDFKGNGWTLILEQPVKVAFAPARDVRDKIIIILSVIGALSIFVVYLFSRVVTRPIKRLGMASDRIGKGDLDVKVEVTSQDEIGRLAESFNQMVGGLKESRDRLLAYSSELETRVSERTRELKSINAQLGLELDIRARTEDALRASEARLETLFEYSPISIWEEDFSQVKARIEQLRASGVRDWRMHLENHPDEVLRCAGLVRILDVNKTSVEFFESEKKEDIPTNLPAYFTDESPAVFKQQLIALAEGKTFFESEIPIMTPGGARKVLFLTLAVVPGFAETLGRVLVSFVDITERKHSEDALRKAHDGLEVRVQERTAQMLATNTALQTEIAERKRAEDALRESEKRLLAAQMSAHIGNLEWNLITKEFYWSDETHRIFGLDPQKAAPSLEAFLGAVEPGELESVKKSVEEALSEGRPYDLDFHIIRPDGAGRIVNAKGQVDFDEAGKALRMIGTVQDITERKQAEEMLKSVNNNLENLVKERTTRLSMANELLKNEIAERKLAEEQKEKLQSQLIQSQKMEAIGTLTGGIAHDFNNIITVIKTLTSLALNNLDENSPLKEYLDPLPNITDRATNLIQQLLIYSQKKPFKRASINLNDTIQDLLSMLKTLISEDISIEKRLAYGLWSIEADKGRMEQVITNILINANDAMPQGGAIVIRTENITLTEEQAGEMPGAAPGTFVCLKVADTGAGMENEVLEHIFEPFFTTKKALHTGMGLAVVYGIVNELNGWINVSSEPGAGSTFMIYIPAAAESIAQEVEEPPHKTPSSGKGKRILLVEDEKWVRKSTAIVLCENGYEVFEASNAEEAISVFYREKGRFDLVLSDVVMPGRNGLQLVGPLLDINPDIPILLCSGYLDDKAQLDQIIKRGLPYIQKPYEIPELLEAIEDTMV